MDIHIHVEYKAQHHSIPYETCRLCYATPMPRVSLLTPVDFTSFCIRQQMWFYYQQHTGKASIMIGVCNGIDSLSFKGISFRDFKWLLPNDDNHLIRILISSQNPIAPYQLSPTETWVCGIRVILWVIVDRSE